MYRLSRFHCTFFFHRETSKNSNIDDTLVAYKYGYTSYTNNDIHSPDVETKKSHINTGGI